MGRWYLINLYTLSSIKGTHPLSPRSDFRIKNGFIWEVFPKGGRGGPLFPNLEAKIPPKSDFFEKNKIAPYGLKCKINHKKFQLRGSQKGGWGRGVRHLGKIPKKYPFFWTPTLSNVDDGYLWLYRHLEYYNSHFLKYVWFMNISAFHFIHFKWFSVTNNNYWMWKRC